MNTDRMTIASPGRDAQVRSLAFVREEIEGMLVGRQDWNSDQACHYGDLTGRESQLLGSLAS